VIHHSQNQIHFDKWRPASLTSTGQAFGPQLEVRWWPLIDDRWEMLLISEGTQPHLSEAGWQEERMAVGGEERVYLWGEHWHSRVKDNQVEGVPDGWVQAEIEADLRYPVAEGGKEKSAVVAIARTYRQQGIARLTRFVTVKAAVSKEE
jgi:hypothetical protein